MRTRAVTLTVALGLGAVALSPALPAAAKNSPLNVKALTNSINHAKNLTYLAQYTSFSNGQKTTVTIAQSPPKSNFTTSSGQRDQQRQDDVLLLDELLRQRQFRQHRFDVELGELRELRELGLDLDDDHDVQVGDRAAASRSRAPTRSSAWRPPSARPSP